MSRNTFSAVFAVLLALSSIAPRSLEADSNWTMRLDLRGQRIEGTLVHLNDAQAILLGRDGRLWGFAPTEAKNYHKVSGTFSSYSQAQMRGELMREFGRKYEVSGTGHYLVVHPAGWRDEWAERFEQLYRSFVHYFTARGIRPQSPQFPMVAVVLPTQRAYMQYVASQGDRPSANVLGHYATDSNRIIMFDVTAGKPNSKGWQQNAETIIHEATHQTAFNTGIHNRVTVPPFWVVEGLATMFEAPGVWDRSRHPNLNQRVNRQRWKQFRVSISERPTGWLRPLIASDDLFKTQPSRAYAASWAVTFYLMEKQPAEYGRYLRKTANWPIDREYGPRERLAHFTSILGENWTMLETRIARYTAELTE